MNNQRNIMSGIIRIIAGAYVIYLAKNLMSGYLHGEISSIVFPIASVLFVLAGIYFIFDGLRSVIRYSKEYTNAQEPEEPEKAEDEASAGSSPESSIIQTADSSDEATINMDENSESITDSE